MRYLSLSSPLQQRVYKLIIDAGDGGLTDAELALNLSNSVNAVRHWRYRLKPLIYHNGDHRPQKI